MNVCSLRFDALVGEAYGRPLAAARRSRARLISARARRRRLLTNPRAASQAALLLAGCLPVRLPRGRCQLRRRNEPRHPSAQAMGAARIRDGLDPIGANRRLAPLLHVVSVGDESPTLTAGARNDPSPSGDYSALTSGATPVPLDLTTAACVHVRRRRRWFQRHREVRVPCRSIRGRGCAARDEDDIDELMGYVAAEAKHEENRCRERRLDDTFKVLTRAIEAPRRP